MTPLLNLSGLPVTNYARKQSTQNCKCCTGNKLRSATEALSWCTARSKLLCKWYTIKTTSSQYCFGMAIQKFLAKTGCLLLYIIKRAEDMNEKYGKVNQENDYGYNIQLRFTEAKSSGPVTIQSSVGIYLWISVNFYNNFLLSTIHTAGIFWPLGFKFKDFPAFMNLNTILNIRLKIWLNVVK